MSELLLKRKKKLVIIDNSSNQYIESIIDRIFRKMPLGMTKYQIQNFVLNTVDYPTPDSRYWQAKFELWQRIMKLYGLQFDYEETCAKIFYYDARIKKDEDDPAEEAKKQLYLVKKARAEFSKVMIKKNAEDTLREIRVFMETIREIEPNMKHSKDEKETQEEE